MTITIDNNGGYDDNGSGDEEVTMEAIATMVMAITHGRGDSGYRYRRPLCAQGAILLPLCVGGRVVDPFF